MSVRTAIITGGSKGIGAATALSFAKSSYNLVINYRSDDEGAKAVKAACEAMGSQVVLVKGDVSDETILDQMVATTVETFGGIDIIVNNAAATKFARVKDLKALTKEDFQKVYDVNIISAYLLVSKAEEYLRASENDPCIINLSSTSALSGIGSSIAYATSKGALNTLTIALAKILAPDVRVNAICSGFVDTKWWLNYFNDERYERFKQRQKDKAALNRLSKPDNIAHMIEFLVSNPCISGEILRIDSGISMGKL